MTNEELQHWTEYTESLVDELLEDGSNDEAVHTIEHHFSSPNFDLLEKAAIAAFKMGLEVEEPEEAELETGEKVFAFDIITEQYLETEVILDETQKMVALAQQCNVDYDGLGHIFRRIIVLS